MISKSIGFSHKIFFPRLENFFIKSTCVLVGEPINTESKSSLFKASSTDPKATVLGKDQWNWLKKKIKEKSDLTLIASSIQILAKDHPYEKWENFPKEREKLINLINESKKNIILVTGDRHRGGIYKLDNLYELTASSLNRPGGNFKESDNLLIGNTYNQMNYGILEISEDKVEIFLKDINGNILESEILDI